jgi:hypothetical protein
MHQYLHRLKELNITLPFAANRHTNKDVTKIVLTETRAILTPADKTVFHHTHTRAHTEPPILSPLYITLRYLQRVNSWLHEAAT